jgi:isocitrate dehydrogenase
VEEMNSAQGQHVDIGGYYMPDVEKTEAVMCPSKTFNTILKSAV